MKLPKRFCLLGVFLVIAIAWFEPSASACKCIGPKTPTKAAINRADVAFRGRIVDIRYNEGISPTKRTAGMRKRPTTLIFEVTGVYRGKVAKRTKLSLGRSSCSLDYAFPKKQFQVGKEWVILAKLRPKKGLSTRQCSGSAPLGRIKNFVKRFGTGHSPI